MQGKQQQLFMWQWSQRRARGRNGTTLRGALMGAIGGAVFAFFLAPNSRKPGVHAYDFLGTLLSAATVMALSVPIFAVLSAILARRVFSSQEAMFQSSVQAGVPIPAQRPALSLAERWPLIVVVGVALVIAGFIGFLLLKFG